MHSTRHQFLTIISILLFLSCTIHISRAVSSLIKWLTNHFSLFKDADEHHDTDQDLAAARFQTLKQILSRRALYDPAYGDSWSNYFERKRALFDPAYGDWANSFKRSDD